LQVIELIILAALAAVVLYQLYAVLGRRVGRGPESLSNPQSVSASDAPRSLTALQGARSASQLIVKAYADGDRATLMPLLAPNVMASFEAGMGQRERETRTESVEFLHTPRADLDTIELKEDLAHASVRFLAEIRSRTKGPEGEAVDDRRTAEIWTFERNLKSRNPNWTLAHVDAAEA
jgi:predicted lipid-binding transport protein (Tim44 family)